MQAQNSNFRKKSAKAPDFPKISGDSANFGVR